MLERDTIKHIHLSIQELIYWMPMNFATVFDQFGEINYDSKGVILVQFKIYLKEDVICEASR